MVQSLDDARRRSRASSNRVPPHDLTAEESLLGSMLLSRDAIAAAVELCRPDHFYKPAHGHVFEAIESLYGQGEPADPVTVADELRRADLLDAIGGIATLISLQANTPATTNAARYARIVEEHALLRRLIAVAGEIAEIGYALPDDVEAAIDRAEAMVFEVAERRVTDTLMPIRELLSDSLDRLEALYGRGESITGVPTGYIDLDERLSGLQKSALYIVGARPAMGKCVAWDTRIVDPATGALATIEDLYLARARSLDDPDPAGPTMLLSLGEDRRLRPALVGGWVDDGLKPVFRVRTRLGREVRTTATHPFLSSDGWRPLMDLAVGARIAVPGELAVFGTDRLPDAAVVAMAQALGRPNMGRQATDRHVPSAVFRLPRYQVALFLHRLWLTGSDRHKGQGRGVPRRQAYRSQSHQLVRDLQHLLLRFGIKAGIRSCSIGRATTRNRAFELKIVPGDISRFGSHIGIRTAEIAEQHLDATAAELRWRSAVPGLDTGRSRCADYCVEQSSPQGATAVATICDGPRPGDHLVAPAVDDGPDDIYWDEIVAITPDGMDQVYDLTVPVTHNFVANDIVVHNTAFALGIAAHAAMDAGHPVAFFSLEMSHAEITQRLLCAEARVDATRVRNGRLLESDWPKITQAVSRLGEAPIFIDDNPALTIMDIRGKARRLKSREGGLSLIIVDYLQLMSGRSQAESRQVEISEISRGLKILARELEVPVIALSQLSRNLEMRADKRPMLADLRESGSLEQDADVVMFIYRDEIYNPESADRGTAEIIVAKHRNGPTGFANLAFLDHVTRFANMART